MAESLFAKYAFDKKSVGQSRFVDPVEKILNGLAEQRIKVESEMKNAHPTFDKYDWVTAVTYRGQPAYDVKIGHFPLEIAGERNARVPADLKIVLQLFDEAKTMIENNTDGLADQIRKQAEERSKKLSGPKTKKK